MGCFCTFTPYTYLPDPDLNSILIRIRLLLFKSGSASLLIIIMNHQKPIISDIWLYSSETKEKFAPKVNNEKFDFFFFIWSTWSSLYCVLQNLKRKGYTEGLDQIEHTPEIAAVDVSLYQCCLALPYRQWSSAFLQDHWTDVWYWSWHYVRRESVVSRS